MQPSTNSHIVIAVLIFISAPLVAGQDESTAISLDHQINVTTNSTNGSAACSISSGNGDCSNNQTVSIERLHQESIVVSNHQTNSGADAKTKNISNLTTGPEDGEWVKISPQNDSNFWIMTYEATKSNQSATNPLPRSRFGEEPWNNVSQLEAKRACSRLGDEYGLATNYEWQKALDLGSSTLAGNTDSGQYHDHPKQDCQLAQDTAWNVNYCLTGTGPNTWTAPSGTVDMVGNLWEWTATTINTSDKELASASGYIQGWNEASVWPTSLNEELESSTHKSWFFASNGSYAVRRGGSWSTSQLSGPFTMSVDRKPTHQDQSIGFRCVYRPNI